MKKLPILLPYQSSFNNDKSPVAVWEKSRRIGASYGYANEAVLHTAGGSGNFYYLSYNKEMTQSFINDCTVWIKKISGAVAEIEEEIVTDEDKQILIYTIRTDSGKIIQALPSAPRVLRSKGRPGDITVVDEAAFCDDLDELLKAAVAFTVWGGKVRLISTHNGDNNPFNLLIQDIHSGRVDYSLHRTTLDDAIKQGFWDKICEVTEQPNTPERFKVWYDKILHDYRHNKDEELFCIPSAGTGSYLPRIIVEPQMLDVPVVRFDGDQAFNIAPLHLREEQMNDWLIDNVKPLLDALDNKEQHFLGEDFARNGDLTVLAPLRQASDLRRYVPFLVELYNVPFAQQYQVVKFICSNLPRFGGAGFDAGGNGAQIAEAAKDDFGSKIEEVKFSENFYRENFPKYKAAFEDKILFIPKSDDVMDDHRAVTIINGVPKLPKAKTDSKNKRHGDSVIAILLAYLASQKDVITYDGFETVGQDNRRGLL